VTSPLAIGGPRGGQFRIKRPGVRYVAVPSVPPRPWQAAVARAGAWVGATLALALVSAGCRGANQSRYGMPPPITEQGHSILGLWRGMFVTAAVVGAIVWALIGWAIVRYRKRPGDESLPKQTQYHIPLEITYTIIPVVIVAVIFVFVVKVENSVNATAAPAAVSVRVEGFQWGWRFTYLNADGTPAGPAIVGDQSSPPTLKLPAFETVRLILVADDVNHSFYVPNFLFKRDLIAGVTNTVELYIDKVGTFPGHCAEFCGLHHADMGFQLDAVPKDQFSLPLAAGASP
jgi:cytochrome c oxidase subunit 2